MTRAGDKRHLTVVNGKDALDTPITTDYLIGGSQWRDYRTYRDNNYRGEYHFSVIDKNQDFSITTTSGGWLLLLYVELYDSPEVISENSILADDDAYQLLNNGGYNNDNYGNDGMIGIYNLHYYGQGERAALDYSTVTTTGTVTFDERRFQSINEFKTRYISKVGEFGTFRMRLNCYSFDSNNTRYCTDFAWRTQAVGYMQYKHYPYTWDFTDIKPYAASGMTKENFYQNSDNQGTTTYPRNHWETANGGYGQRVAVDAGHNLLFCSDSQLWYGQSIIPETAGLGFHPTNNDAAYNSALTMTDEGLTIAQDIRDWWMWRIIVPQVSSDEVVYVRAHRLPQETIDNPLYGNPNYPNATQTVDVPFYNAGYYYGDAPYKANCTPFDSEGNVPKMYEVVSNDESGDVIYVIPGDASTKNITLFFSGITIKKIAVSKDPKKVNIKGWATESRHRVIDPELTGYMTGTNLQTFIVEQQPEGETVSLTRIDDQGVVMDAVPEGTDNNAACIIFNNDPNYTDEGSETEEGITPNRVEILNDGFHLFVPDMHDYGTTDAQKTLVSEKYPNNQLKSAVESGTIVSAQEDGKTNFVLSYKGYNRVTGKRVIGKEGFYKVQDSGIQSAGNQAYLPVANPAEALMFNLSIEESGVNAVDETLHSVPTDESGIYYNLSGLRVKGVPTSRGLYIVNGKKVIIK